MKKFNSVLALSAVVLTFSGCEQAHVDAQMEKLCGQDGGMKIYEKVVLPKEQFTKYGDVKFFETTVVGGGYRIVTKSESINVIKPIFDVFTWNRANLTKTTYTVIREADNKVIGIYIVYLRTGGVFYQGWDRIQQRTAPKMQIR
jgi:hypothetical protein